MGPLKVAAWNANGASSKTNEILAFIELHKIDILLLSETHFVSRSTFRVPGFTLHTANHPDDSKRGGAAISKGLRQQEINVQLLTELSSDHLPLLF